MSICDGFDYKGGTKSSDTELLFIVPVRTQSTVVMLNQRNIWHNIKHNVTLFLISTNNYYY